MPNIYDNIEPDQKLLPALQGFIKEAYRADFSVGYFNLRGWGQLDSFIEPWLGGEGACCRLMIGMQSLPKEELRLERSLTKEGQTVIDQKRALRLKRQMAEEFRSQLTFGAPNNADEDCLRRLSSQLKAKKLVVKLFLRNRLHAKLYMLYRKDIATPKIGYLGSSNLTMAGLAAQGELNIDVLDQDACKKLEKWFNDRWEDRWCLDISEDLAEIIDTSWAREEMIRPYHIYLKMAYHLSQEARAGLAEYSIPREFRNKLFDFQVAAVKIAAHHLNKRGGVLVGDVVGLGKTMMASALARIFQEDQQMKVLIICPKNLVKMWEDYMFRYSIQAKVMSIGMARSEDLSKLPRYKLVILDESHNLRNREGKRFRAIQEYIETNDSKCILLTATPYNKTFLDLSSQLRLFVSGEQDLGIRPEKFLSQLSEAELNALQVQPRTLAAFEKSEHIDDWRDLMRLYMVRRTRSFIQENYAQLDKTNGRKYLTFEDGSRSYFPDRVPRTIKFAIDEKKASNQYALLYSEGVVEAVNGLKLPRYGLGNYILTKPKQKPDAAEKKQLDNLSRAGKRLMGFCRTNLFKRLESGGPAFIQSIERHILRNYVFIYALEHGLDLPLGSQDAGLLDTNTYDGDAEAALPGGVEAIDDDASPESDTEEINVSTLPNVNTQPLRTREEYLARAEAIYNEYAAGKLKKRFKWLRPTLLNTDLKKHLMEDALALLKVLTSCGGWEADHDAKLNALVKLLRETHPDQKVLIFSQFADTVRYLTDQLKRKGIKSVGAVTGDSEDTTDLVWRFSPVSNNQRNNISIPQEIRVLITTDVLSEGQNLQDAAIVVNYDLPWAIIRLIQRAGRVDRIGQQAAKILCYTFLPADGVEQIIRLRARVRERLRQNAEVVGTDEAFFEDDGDKESTALLTSLYHEKSGILDGETDNEVDLASYAYQIWKNATDADPSLKAKIAGMPEVVYSTRQYVGSPTEPQGVLLYISTTEGNDALAWIDQNGKSVTQSQLAILRAAECSPNTPAIVRNEQHHSLVEEGVRLIAEVEQTTGGLGKSGGARFRTYGKLNAYADKFRGGLFEKTEAHQTLLKAIHQILHYPLRDAAKDTLNRQLKSGINDDALAELVINFYKEDRLCIVHEEGEIEEPKIICSLGLFN